MGYGLFGWIVVGLVAGGLARLLHPGRDPGGLGVTLVVGIAGGVMGGWLGRLLGAGPHSTLLNLALATAGALLLLVLWRAIARARAGRS
ncbi:GlsB/YeaQ/YmgE family stress response membrane protein [Thermaurantiacus sp.]